MIRVCDEWRKDDRHDVDARGPMHASRCVVAFGGAEGPKALAPLLVVATCHVEIAVDISR